MINLEFFSYFTCLIYQLDQFDQIDLLDLKEIVNNKFWNSFPILKELRN